MTPEHAILRHRSTGLLIGLDAHRGFSSPRIARMLGDRQRNRDINGDGIGLVMQETGWCFADYPFMATARAQDVEQAVAAGWAAPIRWGVNSALGVNLSYATMSGFEGHGLARVSVAAAFIRLCTDQPAISLGRVNIQCDRENTRSISLAQSLGFVRNADADFTVPKLNRTYLAFSCDATRFEEIATSILEQSCDELELATTADHPRIRG